jgi:hypothetical protein
VWVGATVCGGAVACGGAVVAGGGVVAGGAVVGGGAVVCGGALVAGRVEPVPAGRVALAVGWGLAAALVEAVAVGVDGAGAPTDGEKIAGTDEDGPPVQAETDADRRMVAVAQPAAVSLDLLTLMRPPCTPQAAA